MSPYSYLETGSMKFQFEDEIQTVFMTEDEPNTVFVVKMKTIDSFGDRS